MFKSLVFLNALPCIQPLTPFASTRFGFLWGPGWWWWGSVGPRWLCRPCSFLGLGALSELCGLGWLVSGGGRPKMFPSCSLAAPGYSKLFPSSSRLFQAVPKMFPAVLSCSQAVPSYSGLFQGLLVGLGALLTAPRAPGSELDGSGRPLAAFRGALGGFWKALGLLLGPSWEPMGRYKGLWSAPEKLLEPSFQHLTTQQ